MVNWYKKAAVLEILSYSNDGTLSVMFEGGEKYTYENVTPFLYNSIKSLLNKSNFSTAIKMLKNIEKNTPETSEDKEEILDELYDRGIL